MKVFQHEFSNLSLPFEGRFYKLRLFWLSRVCHTLPSVCDTVTRVCDSNGGVCDIVTRVRFVTHSREFATWGRRSRAPSTLRLRIFFSVHTSPEKFDNATNSPVMHLGFVSEDRDCCDAIIVEKLRFQNVFVLFSNSLHSKNGIILTLVL